MPGEFIKYINNDGECLDCPQDDLEELFQKAQCLSHFSYEYSNLQEIMILNIQGAGYSLYDPEISTRLDVGSKQSSQSDMYDETYFCAGNLSSLGINEFKKQHRCNKFCEMMGFGAMND